MIITRSPLRISLGGGGTDLPQLLPRAHGLSHRGGQSINTSTSRLHETFVPGPDHQVFQARARLLHRRHRTSHHPRGHAADGVARQRVWNSHPWRTFPQAPVWVPRAALPRRCSRLCTRTNATSSIRLNSPNRLVTSSSKNFVNPSANRISTSRGLRRDYVFRVSSRRPGKSLASSKSARTPATTSKTTCCCSSPAIHARRRKSSRNRTTKVKGPTRA